jgi:hypothetical protein
MSDEFREEELELSLRRAFVDRRADYIIYDGHTARNRFLSASISFGKERGWLTEPQERGDEQWKEYHYRLSKKGREHFGLMARNR